MTKDKTPIQNLINGKPSEFARRIGCPKSTANHYSDGTRTPPDWVLKLIEFAIGEEKPKSKTKGICVYTKDDMCEKYGLDKSIHGNKATINKLK